MKHNVWASNDGSWGSGSVVFIELTEQEVRVFAELNDLDRTEIAWMVNDGHPFPRAFCLNRGHHDSGDNPVDENGEALCETCGEGVNANPDLG